MLDCCFRIVFFCVTILAKCLSSFFFLLLTFSNKDIEQGYFWVCCNGSRHWTSWDPPPSSLTCWRQGNILTFMQVDTCRIIYLDSRSLLKVVIILSLVYRITLVNVFGYDWVWGKLVTMYWIACQFMNGFGGNCWWCVWMLFFFFF